VPRALVVMRRRALLSLPLLAAPALRAGAAAPVPPFPSWIGRTALIAGEGAAARLTLTEDGTGVMAVRLFFFCRALPIRFWQAEEDGMSLRYSRASALDPARLIQGEAHIQRDGPQLLWIEAARHVAEFQGFAAPDTAGRCG